MKCAQCKAINQEAESLRHPNPTTIHTHNLLKRKASDMRKRNDARRHFCATHLQVKPDLPEEETAFIPPFTSGASEEYINKAKKSDGKAA